MVKRIVHSFLLPSLLFLPISVTVFKCLFVDLPTVSKLPSEGFCPNTFDGTSPYERHYVGGYSPGLENIACAIITAFSEAVDTERRRYLPYMTDFLVSLWIYTAVLFVESYRVGSRVPPMVVMIIQLLAQYFTGAVMQPVFWVLYFATSANNNFSTIRKGDADAVFVGTIIGYLLPTVAFLIKADVLSNLAWQLFPPLVYGAIVPYRLFAKKTQKATYGVSGHSSVSSLYGLIFFTTLVTHLGAFAAHDFKFKGLIGDWLPPNIPPPKSASAAEILIYMLQWDGLFIFGGLALGGIFLAADSVLEAIGIAAWFAATYFTLSPGAGVSAVFWWREKKLQRQRKIAKK